jgi:hypothetical protein
METCTPSAALTSPCELPMGWCGPPAPGSARGLLARTCCSSAILAGRGWTGARTEPEGSPPQTGPPIMETGGATPALPIPISRYVRLF